MKSIIQSKKECYFCHTTQGLHSHHIYGGKNRKTSDKNGFTVYLCFNHHTGNEGVHKSEEQLLTFKRLCQKEYEVTNTREDFIRLINKSYLEE